VAVDRRPKMPAGGTGGGHAGGNRLVPV
jgi:hypothetical protein